MAPEGNPPEFVLVGSGDFASSLLRELANGDFSPLRVLTHCDRPAGRGRRPRPVPLKTTAKELGLPFTETNGPKDPSFLEALSTTGAEVLLVADYGFIIPREILAYPPRGCVNVHPSLLPRYRGAAPIRRALMEGADESGVTLMLMDEGLDTGPVIALSSTPIYETDNELSLRLRLAALGSELVRRYLPLWVERELEARPQGEEGASYAFPITRDELLLDWSMPARDIHNRVRALSPRPGAHTFMRDLRLKVLRSALEEAPRPLEPGEVFADRRGKMYVGAGEGSLRLLELQPQGKRAMTAEEFLRGYRPSQGLRLGALPP